jgi:hypothetical protein
MKNHKIAISEGMIVCDVAAQKPMSLKALADF